VDPAAVIAPTLARQAPTSMISAAPGATVVKNIVPVTKSGRPLRSLAGEVSFLPEASSSTAPLCDDDPARQWKALVTFPSCDLIALLDLPSGQIQSAAKVLKTSAGGVELVQLADGEEPNCPVDCLYPPATPGGGATAMPSDAGATDASGAPAVDAGAASAAGQGDAGATIPGGPPYIGPGALRPNVLTISPQTNRAFVGLSNAAFVLAFKVTNAGIDLSAANSIVLHEGALGVDRVRLSIDPYKDRIADGTPGDFVGNDPALDQSGRQAVSDRQYLYVVARDGSLRVVQVANTSESECETNSDFGSIQDDTKRQMAMDAACPPVTDPPVRRPGAVGPGLRFPTPPVDVAVADIRPTTPDQSETSVTGAHAWVLTAGGSVYLVNIDPVQRLVAWVPITDSHTIPPTTVVFPCATMTDCQTEPPPAPNTIRNRGYVGYSVALDPSLGLPRLDVPPAQPPLGPRIESVWTVGSVANATAQTSDYIQTQVFFPDPSAVTPQTWSVTWEGILTGAPRYSGQVLSNGALRDFGADFCRLDVQNRDIVTLLGCTNTNQCGLGKECVFGSNGAVGAGGLPISGLCLSPDQQNNCGTLLSTVRRYDVSSTSRTDLGLTPHFDELARRADTPCLPTPEKDGGVDARDGSSGGAAVDGGVGGGAAADAGGASAPALIAPTSCIDPTDPSTAKFQCVAGRCLYPCTKLNDTTECRAGRICLAVDTSQGCNAKDNCFCADGPRLTDDATSAAQCLGELLPYQVSVGRGFLVSG
ncbi:MAG TPA: hypothetical protein VHD87_03420, partial [Acidimicrobiales bacterium]|nr:hypothetical protein [Acidimicrobiales bacterium]